MNGPEHYRKAEDWLERAAHNQHTPTATLYVEMAKVHAHLAGVAARIDSFAGGQDISGTAGVESVRDYVNNQEAWHEVLGSDEESADKEAHPLDLHNQDVPDWLK